MKYFPLIWRNLLRRKVRTIFTLASVFIAFVLYSFLMVVQNAFSMGVEVAGVDRLVLMHKVSLIQLLPVSYADRIRGTEGVTHVGHSTWFGGMYQDKATQFAVMAVDPAYFQLYPEARIQQEQLQAWLADRQGVIVGRTTATRYGWNIGDKIPIQATIWQPKQGNTWFFNVDGIYDADRGFDTSNFFFHYEYLDENRRGAYGRSAGMSCVSTTRPTPLMSLPVSTRSSPIRPPKRRPPPKRRSCRGSSTRLETSRRSSSRFSPPSSSRCSCSCWRTRWRSRFANGPASLRCSRRSASPMVLCSVWCWWSRF
jgi:hypothetical protein